MKKQNFYQKVYWHVALAVLWFIIIEYFLLQSDVIVKMMLSFLDGYLWLVLLWLFMVVTHFATKMANNNSEKSIQYAWLILYIIAEAFLFVPLIYAALLYTNSVDLLTQAAIVTLFLFVGLSVVAFTTKKDFSILKSSIYIWGAIAMGLIIAWILFGFNLGLRFSVGMSALAGASILYQTSNIIHKYNEEQYVAAALGLFASLMLLFWYILQIFMSRD